MRLMDMLRSSRTSTAVVVALIAVVLVTVVGLLVVQGNGDPDGDLSEAVRAGDAGLVRAYLEADAVPDEHRVLGLTPLMRAAARDDAAIVTLVSPLLKWPLRPTRRPVLRLSSPPAPTWAPPRATA
jgi:hypothetical protein